MCKVYYLSQDAARRERVRHVIGTTDLNRYFEMVEAHLSQNSTVACVAHGAATRD
jgi:hypothetical protein